MRCFIALNLPPNLKDYLFELQRKNKTKDAKINWVAKKNLHITLKFLGEISEDKLTEIKKRLLEIKAKTMNVKLSSIGVFPDEIDPRVLWVGLSPETDIVKLAQKIDEETLDLVSSEQQFTAHITLGRIKSIQHKANFKKFLKELKVDKIPCTVESFSLYKSTLSSQGPSYEEIERYSLG